MSAPDEQRRAGRRIWLSPRALKLHVVILIVVPAFLAMCIWQLFRALGGNQLSWAYVFEWPLFAAYAVYMWWRLLHETTDAVPSEAEVSDAEVSDAEVSGAVSGAEVSGAEVSGGEQLDAPHHGLPLADPDEEARIAYNEYLAQLAERDRAAGR